MSEIVSPSRDTENDSFNVSGVIAEAGGIDGYVVQGANTSDLAALESTISEGNLNAFDESNSAASHDVTIDAGEAFVKGSWLAKDTSTTVTLTSNSSSQEVYLGWDESTGNNVIIGKASAFASEDPKVLIYEYDTDGTGVTSVSDERQLGPPEAAKTDIADTNGVVLESADQATFVASGASSVSVTDQGNAEAEVEVSSTDTNTQTDVEASQTSVVTDAQGISFEAGSDLTVNVTDDGDNSATVEYDASFVDTRTDIQDSGQSTVVADAVGVAFEGSNDATVTVSDDGDDTATVDIDVSTNRVDVADSSGTVLADPTEITFSSGGDISTNVVDDGDGTATVTFSSIDNKVNISDDGTQLVTDADDIDFTDGITASDDGDGSVTVTADKDTTDGASETGDGSTTTFSLSHNLGATPSTAHVTPRTEAAAADFWVSNKTSSAVEITYSAAPANNETLTYDLTVHE